jgi:hypothetical protein
MAGKRFRSAIPRGAREIVREYDAAGVPRSSDYFVRRRLVGRRHWDGESVVQIEYGMRDGKLHGAYYEWHENGNLRHATRYANGLEHGMSRQYDSFGQLIGTYRMRNGTGVDLWYVRKGRLSEERHCRNGRRHGFERWWRDSRTVFAEGCYKDGVEHGIFRDWNAARKLRRGFPQYFVEGRRVTRRQYLRARALDETLPPFLKLENLPRRKCPNT